LYNSSTYLQQAKLLIKLTISGGINLNDWCKVILYIEGKRFGQKYNKFKAIHIPTNTTLREFQTKDDTLIASQVTLYVNEYGIENMKIMQR